jgi:hypothetical protein
MKSGPTCENNLLAKKELRDIRWLFPKNGALACIRM